MAENFGGPVWHASGRGATPKESLRLARVALQGVGDAKLLERVENGIGLGIVHIQRRLTDEERETFAVPEPYDIRGSDEERRRIAVVIGEAPHLRQRLEAMYGRVLP